MKKTLLILTLLLSFLPSLFANDVLKAFRITETEKNPERLEAAISKLALSEDDRLEVYYYGRKDSTRASVTNLLLGFGSGSFMQGDEKGGWIGLLWGLVNLSLLESYAFSDVASTVLTLSFIAERTWSYWRPVSWARKYNASLMDALLLAAYPTDGGITVTGSFSF